MSRSAKPLFLACALALPLAASGGEFPDSPQTTLSEPAIDVEGMIASLTLEEKVSQLLMVGIEGTEISDKAKAQLSAHGIGGVCLFRRNLHDATQAAKLTRAIRSLFNGQIPPFIALDQEGGNVVRIADKVAVLPGNMALGATHSRRLAYEAGRVQAIDLKLLGFNMNLAPVLDVNENPKNPVIGIRSFGDRAGMVAEFGTDFVRGQQAWGIATVAKHFPGHGGTNLDSHKAMPEIDASLSDLVNHDLAPFRAVIDIGVDGVMSAHIALPRLTMGIDEPATVSPAIIEGLLRGKLHFDGLVLTDELEMEAIAARYGPGRAAVMAIRAGADMVLIPWRPEKQHEVYAAVLDAARRLEITEARLNAAVRHVLTVKRLRNILVDRPPPLNRAIAALDDAERRALVAEIARSSITLVKNDGKTLPLEAASHKRIAVISVQPRLARAIHQLGPEAPSLKLPMHINKNQEASFASAATRLAQSADAVVLGVANETQLPLVNALLSLHKPTVVVCLASPYLADDLGDAAAVLMTYSSQDVSVDAAARAIIGETGTPGRLPVSTSRFAFGTGIETAQTAQSLPGANQSTRVAGTEAHTDPAQSNRFGQLEP